MWLEEQRMPKTSRTKSTPAARTAGASRANGSDAASRREQRRLLHQDLSRSQLLDAAEEVFGAKGFHDTTLKEIAELAEFSVGSVYSFFENKDDLFLNVFLRRGEEMLPEMRAVVNGDGTPRDQLHRLVDYEVGFFRDHPHFGRLYVRSASAMVPATEMPTAPSLTHNFELAMEIQADLFARGQKAKQFRAGDPLVLARLLSGLVAAYQSLDPAVVSDDDRSERLPLAHLHDIIDGAFSRT
jgi:AcrR family transcriptional regulator